MIHGGPYKNKRALCQKTQRPIFSQGSKDLCASEGSPFGRAPAIAGERGLQPLPS